MTSKNTHTNGNKPTNKIVITNPLLVSLVKKKEALVLEGREISKKIEEMETRATELKEIEREYTGKCATPELMAEGERLQKVINDAMEELEKVSKQVRETKLASIPVEIREEHLKLNDDKAKLEKDLNKVGLAIEKIKAKYIPKVQKIARKDLKDEFEDLETSELVGDAIVVSTFSHLTEWKKKFRERAKENKYQF